MGTDIQAIYVADANKEVHTLNIERSYALFGWLADVRNYSAVTPLSQPRDLPEDLQRLLFPEPKKPPKDYIGFSAGYENPLSTLEMYMSWYSLEELLAVDYDQTIEDRRCKNGETCEPGEGKLMTLRDFLGTSWFTLLEFLKAIGPGRLVFGFD